MVERHKIMAGETFDVDVQACRSRQQRLLSVMHDKRIERAIIVQAQDIQWLTGARFGPLFEPVASLDGDGRMTLVAPSKKLPVSAAVDEVLTYEAQWHSTLRNDQRQASSEVLLRAIDDMARIGCLGVEFSSFGPHLARNVEAELVDLEPALYYLRRRKDPDELRMMRKAIKATKAMYAKAREVIEPGINELDLYTRLYAVAVDELGEPPTYFGQDFQCHSRGGPPRDRAANAGELYILDLGAGFRGYFSDNARTICVGRRPSEEQTRAWEQIQRVFAMIESTVKPGTSCRQVFESAQRILDECSPWQFNHHLGHGVGLFPHEAPHLNPHWDDRFEVGDFFTVEPGLYHDTLRAGMRLEQNYLVTRDGVELLTDMPLEL